MIYSIVENVFVLQNVCVFATTKVEHLDSLRWGWRLGRPPGGSDSLDGSLLSTRLWIPHALRWGLAEVRLTRKGGSDPEGFPSLCEGTNNPQVDMVSFHFNGEKTLEVECS